MAIKQVQFRVADTTVGKRQGYLCYLRNKPYALFLKSIGKTGCIRVMAKTDKYTVDVGVVPENTWQALKDLMNHGTYIYVNESQIVKTSSVNFSMDVTVGWYA